METQISSCCGACRRRSMDIIPSLSVKIITVGCGESSLKKSKNNRKNNIILCKTSGTTYYMFDGKRVRISEGDVICLPDGATYSVETTVPGGYIAVVFSCTGAFLEPIVSRIPGIADKFAELYRSFNASQNEVFRGYSVFFGILYRLLLGESGRSVSRDRREKIKAAAELINNGYADHSFRLSNVCRVAGVSNVYFCRVFRELYGMTPSDYLIKTRLAAAKKLLFEGVGIADTAYATGFSDPLYFSKFFRKHTGFPPTKYVEKFAE